MRALFHNTHMDSDRPERSRLTLCRDRKPVDRQRSPRAYRLYGLWLRSQWPLPYPAGTKAGLAEVELFEGEVSLFSEAAREAMVEANATKWFHHARLQDGSTYVRWSGLFEFVISASGLQIAGRPLNGVSQEAFQTYLLGQVLSFALVEQGIEPLHSTAVVIDGGAVGFIGDCGYGKSSLGAAFLQAGFPLLTDDQLVVKEEDHGFSAYPGPPRIKLFPEIARSLLGKRGKGTPMNNLTPKLIIPLNRRQSCRDPVPLKAIYVLTPPATHPRSKGMMIRPLSQRRVSLELLRNTFNPVIIERERLKHQFLLVTRLAANVKVRSLSYPRTLAFLPSVREAVLSDLVR